MRYSPLPATEYFRGFDENTSLAAWNLIYLVANFREKHPFEGCTHLLPSVRHTVNCDLATGKWTGKGPFVAEMLRKPAAEFVAWAETSPITPHLPISHEVPDWLSRAKKNLAICVVPEADPDVWQARAYLAKFLR